MTTALPSHTTPEVRSLLADALLHELSHGLGGPYHVLFPERFDANAAAFREVFAEAGVDGRVYYAKKANKAAVYAGRAAVAGLGVDVASHGELREALAAGVRGADLVVTGPAKTDALLRVAVLQGALIAVDALDELDRLIAMSHQLACTARVLLRRLPPEQPHSRFGLDDGELASALTRCVEGPVDMEGFSFHLCGYDVRQRADLAAGLVHLCGRARELGLRADRVSVGGGFAVDYVAAEDWRRFEESRRAEHFHAGKSFGGFYPYHSPVAGADALRTMLAATPAGERTSLAALLRAAGVTLLVEPGRALLDQAGFTVFRVQGVKERDGYAVLTVDGSSLSLSEQWFDSEFLPDPVLVPAGSRPVADAGPYPACVGAATCLESDMLTWRKIPFPLRPAVGDLLVYLNTAGYQMDSNESPFHELPLPPKVVVEPSAATQSSPFRWRLDRHPA
ncbi:Y4yA family PLP-dependent enzyme [Streptomyces soliscabiei]|uniref:Y4yA family PLP-dependent enzyme n=1 Tax=Streptomyces soliscabiei TaxID=588897 RepID=UPI0029A5321C|nr:Y4yA family PLP-dependent enzyme [Streptomyces sp. NY05-11A]MDX2682922.1 Y4yA family PLP-dependent enzyme [Streptomyces sp. NY05-11A]